MVGARSRLFATVEAAVFHVLQRPAGGRNERQRRDEGHRNRGSSGAAPSPEAMGGTAVFQFCESPQQPSNLLTRPPACLALAKLSGGLTLGTKRVLINCVRVRVTGDSESLT